MSTVEIRLGKGWLLDALCDRSPTVSPIDTDFSLVLGTFDLVVDGDNLTAKVPRDQVVHVVSDLLECLRVLVTGEANKALLTFRERPWELVLCSAVGKISASVYRLGLRPMVVVHNRPVDLRSLVSEAIRVAKEITDALLEVDRDHAKAKPVEELTRRATLLAAAEPKQGSPREPQCSTVDTAEQHRTRKPPAGSPCGLGYEIDLTYEELHRYDGELRVDLHALLAPGGLTLHVGDEAVALDADYPFAAILSLVEDVHTLMRFFCRAREDDGPVASANSTHLLGVQEVRPSGEVVLSSPTSIRGPRKPAGIVVLDDLVREVVAASRSLIADFVAVQPRVRLNRRIDDLTKATDDLAVRWRLVKEGDFSSSASADLSAGPARSLPAPEGFGHALKTIRRLIPAARWRWCQPDIRFADVVLCGRRVVARSSHGVVGIDLDQGDVVWQRMASADVQLTAQVSAPSTLLVQSGLHVEALDIHTGETGWRRPLTNERTLGAVALDDTIAIVGDDTVVGVDRLTGATAWTFAAELAGLRTFSSHGACLIVAGPDGFVHGISLKTGDRMWRKYISTGPVIALSSHRDVALVFVVLAGVIQVVALEADTGRERWTRMLRGRLAAPPHPINGANALLMGAGDRVVLVRLALGDGEVAALADFGPDRRVPLPTPLVDEASGLTVVRDAQSVAAYETDTGLPRWRQRTAEDDTDSVDTLDARLVGGALVVPGKQSAVLALDTGVLLHQLDALTTQPAFLDVSNDLHFVLGERGDEDEDDALECFAIEHFLAVVK